MKKKKPEDSFMNAWGYLAIFVVITTLASLIAIVLG